MGNHRSQEGDQARPPTKTSGRRNATLRRSTQQARAELSSRLRSRAAELEQAISVRVEAVADGLEPPDRRYTEGVRAAVSTAVDYGIDGVELGERRSPSVPPELLAQARLAARNGVELATVLQRYVAGFTQLNVFLCEEAAAAGLLGEPVFTVVSTALANLFGRLQEGITEAYKQEAEARAVTGERRRVEQVRKLFDGKWVDTDDLNYEFDAWHVGLVAVGAGATQAIRELVGAFDCHSLVVSPDEDTAWAWLGSRRGLRSAAVRQQLIDGGWPAHTPLALGEPGEGWAGWRLTHRQASAALLMAMSAPAKRPLRYADSPLLAAALRDELLAASLRQLYLDPLERGRDEGALTKAILRAYIGKGLSTQSAASVVGRSRNTVARHVGMAEERIGCSLLSCMAALEVALCLDEVSGHAHCATL